MSSSHNGEAIHVAAVRALLKRAGLTVQALRCPPAWPLDEDTMARARSRRRELHDCSGKHAGMLLACVGAGWDPATYERAGHPLQRRVRRAVLAATGLGSVTIGVDGCGVPVHAMPLASMATLYARLTEPGRLGELADHAGRAVAGMLADPYMVGGAGRLDTAIMRATGDVLAKEGAEASACAAVLPSGLGVAVKVADGGERAVGPVLIAALSQIDALTLEHRRALEEHQSPAVLGGGRPVGRVVADITLRHFRSGSLPPVETLR
jgi:L-asparaginase II